MGSSVKIGQFLSYVSSLVEKQQDISQDELHLGKNDLRKFEEIPKLLKLINGVGW